MPEVVPIREEPAYKVSDIVTNVQLVVDVGHGKLSFSTHLLRDAELEEYKQELDKLTNAADWLAAKYGLRNLELQLEQEEKSISQFRLDRENYLLKCQTDWNMGQRRGDMRLTESQRNLLSNHDNSINSRLAAIEKLKKDIAITKKILEGHR